MAHGISQERSRTDLHATDSWIVDAKNCSAPKEDDVYFALQIELSELLRENALQQTIDTLLSVESIR